MSGTMSQADVLADLKASLGDAGKTFNAPDDADFLRHLATALAALQQKRPRTLLGELTITADEPSFAVPQADFATFKTFVWGAGKAGQPWQPGYPGATPRVRALHDGSSWTLAFEPPPTQAQISAWGTVFRYWYFGLHSLGDDAADSTLAAADRPLLLLRAQAEAMRELAMRNVHKPVQMRDGLSGAPRNSTPSALFRELLAEYEAQP